MTEFTGMRMTVAAKVMWLVVFIWCTTCVSTIVYSSSAVGISEAGSVGPHRQRTATVADFIHMRTIRGIQASPDGKYLALEVSHARNGEVGIMPTDVPRTDIYIVDLDTLNARRITSGHQNASSGWSALWAPDGQHLAFLTDEGLGHRFVRIAVWDRRTQRVSILDSRSVDIRVNWGNESAWRARQWGEWLNNRTVVAAFLPSGELADKIRYDAPITPARDWDQLWSRTRAGKASVTVWRSSSEELCGSEDDIISVDVETAGERHLFHGDVRGVSISPHGRYMAVVFGAKTAYRGSNSATADMGFEFGGYRADLAVNSGLALVDVQTAESLGTAVGVEHLNTQSVRLLPVWGENDDVLAVASHCGPHCDMVYRVAVPHLVVSRYAARSALDAQLVARLAIQGGFARIGATSLKYRAKFSGPENVEWDGIPAFKVIPGVVITLPHERVGVLRNGVLTVMDARGRPRAVISGLGARLVVPTVRTATRMLTSTIVTENNKGVIKAVELGGAAPTVKMLGEIPKDASVEVILPDGRMIVNDDTNNGTFVWLVTGSRRQIVFSVNRYLSEVRMPTQRIITYTFEGKRVSGLLWSPPTATSHSKLPLVVWGYPGHYSNTVDGNQISDFYKYPGVLFAAAGYRVLQPTIPVRPNDADPAYDPIVYYVQAVLASVRAAVAQGYADPRKVAYFGWSYGGYLGLALESRTRMFAAIAVLSPYANLIAAHDTSGELPNINECTPNLIVSSGIAQFETRGSPLNLGGPPWLEMRRYVKNSPYFHLGDAITPLLMEKGEFDWDLPEIRDVFAMLYGRGIPVELAVYWGEGHLLETRGNIADGWTRTLNWFGKWVCPECAGGKIGE